MKPGLNCRYMAAAAGLAGLWLTISIHVPAPVAASGSPSDGRGGDTAPPPGLSNVIRLSPRLYTGSVPEGALGFLSLRSLGVRTVVSVDGARPDLELARRQGLRYVHLPFGYGGCPPQTAARIVRAVRDLPAPIYLHCHHGKHRAPAAAAYARIALDGLTPEEAVAEMRRAGTSPHYRELYARVRSYRPSASQIDAATPSFPEVAPRPRVMQSMVEMAAALERLTRRRKGGRGAAAGPPDAVAAHEALQLRELFTELERHEAARPREFLLRLRDGAREASRLEGLLRRGSGAAAGKALTRLTAGCSACHRKYRDAPVSGHGNLQ